MNESYALELMKCGKADRIAAMEFLESLFSDTTVEACSPPAAMP